MQTNGDTMSAWWDVSEPFNWSWRFFGKLGVLLYISFLVLAYTPEKYVGWAGLAFWGVIANLSRSTREEKIKGASVTVPVKKYPAFTLFNNFRIGAMAAIVIASAFIHGLAFLWWFFNYDGWRYHLGLL